MSWISLAWQAFNRTGKIKDGFNNSPHVPGEADLQSRRNYIYCSHAQTPTLALFTCLEALLWTERKISSDRQKRARERNRSYAKVGVWARYVPIRDQWFAAFAAPLRRVFNFQHMKFMLGTKGRMTQVFDERGVVSAGTIVNAGPIGITQEKTSEKDGYTAVQVC